MQSTVYELIYIKNSNFTKKYSIITDKFLYKMEQYFKEHSDNYDNIKKIISVVRFLDKYIKYGIMTQLKTDDWTLERKSNIPVEGSILIEYHHRQMSLSISGIKYVLGSRYHDNIIVDSSVFVQLMYAIENLHIHPFILINTPIEYLRTFNPKINVITCANIHYSILLSSIGILDHIQWIYDGLGISDDGIGYHSNIEWKEKVQTRIKKWYDSIESDIKAVTPDMVRKKYAISIIKKSYPTFILPMQVL
jgi:hypothetical protein